MTKKQTLREAVAERILVLDGAMGTMLKAYGNNDILVLTQPEVIAGVHRKYLEAGADIITTNTFSAQRISLRELDLAEIAAQMGRTGVMPELPDFVNSPVSFLKYFEQKGNKEKYLDYLVEEINRAAVRIARREADEFTAKDPSRPRFVVGDVGPTSKMLSLSDDVNDPASRAISFDELEAAYFEQMRVFVEEGVDGILVETIFDTLNAKAAISAYQKCAASTTPSVTPHDSVGMCARQGENVHLGVRLPELLLSMTVSDASGRTLSGQTVEAFVTSVLHAKPLSVGLNCGLGASGMVPYLRRMKATVEKLSIINYQLSIENRVFLSCHPNAGLPNQFGEYEDTPEEMVEQMQPYFAENLVNIVGGCCGTTPEHIREIRKQVDAKNLDKYTLKNESGSRLKQVGESFETSRGVVSEHLGEAFLSLSGLDASHVNNTTFFNVGERCNVAGSKKFLRLIKEKNYDEAMEIARKQVEDGAMAIDINMDDGLLDAREEMCHFLKLLASDPDICRIPFMIDSSRFEVIEEALKCVQGRCIVNSISLKQGEEVFLQQARTIRRLGAAVIVMCFDEEGQATDYERRIRICQRAYNLLTEKVGFPPTDIIFDPNILTIATGMAEHNAYALDFIRATEWIHQNLPGTRISGGLSNLSFAFRGNNYLREAMHAVFLYLAIQKGMNMAILNPATAVAYDDIPQDLRKAIEDVILNTDDGATERLMEMAQTVTEKKEAVEEKVEEKVLSVEERLVESLVKGNTTNLEEDLNSALSTLNSPLKVISGPLMAGMNRVGELFGEGKMFLPQVIKTARTMKKAVEILTPYLNNDKSVAAGEKKRVLLATVKGDVHDIGKNIVGIIMSCNNFEVIDLGVMVPAETIVQKAIEEKVDIVCLSGLITPSLEEMCTVAKAMEAAGLRMPIFVGGATTSPIHTAMKIAPLYSGAVFHLRDAAQNPVLATKLLDPETRESVIEENRAEQERLREANSSVDSISSNNSKNSTKSTSTKIVPASLAPAPLGIPQSLEIPDIRLSYIFHKATSDGVSKLTINGEEFETKLAQYVAKEDVVGVFAVTVSQEFIDNLEALKEMREMIEAVMVQSYGDNLVEKAAEQLSIYLKGKGWHGIRPAVGYPSLPEQRDIFKLARLLDFSAIGISLTENGAMYPQSSVSGLLIGNPKAKY